MATVEVQVGESIDEALKRFKKDLARNGRLRDARRHEHYEKPSERKRRAAVAARRRRAKKGS